MTAATATSALKDPFQIVRAIGLSLTGVENATKWDGSPVLRLRGCFMAGLAMHASAEPATLVVRIADADRELLLADAPDAYYVTDYYRPHSVVLVRLARVDQGAIADLLTGSWRLTAAKAPSRAPRRRSVEGITPGDRKRRHG